MRYIAPYSFFSFNCLHLPISPMPVEQSFIFLISTYFKIFFCCLSYNLEFGKLNYAIIIHQMNSIFRNFYSKHVQDCHSKANDQDRMRQNWTITEIKEMRFLLKNHIKFHSWMVNENGLYYSLTQMNETSHSLLVINLIKTIKSVHITTPSILIRVP
jgi:hypothetical protein